MPHILHGIRLSLLVKRVNAQTTIRTKSATVEMLNGA